MAPRLSPITLSPARLALVPAALVRSVIVPAAMALLGRWNWWLPGRGGRAAALEPRVDAA